MLAERWRVYYNTEATLRWDTDHRHLRPGRWRENTAHVKVESKEPFPLFHAPDCGRRTTNPATIPDLRSRPNTSTYPAAKRT